MSRPPIHPGEILHEELGFLEISAAKLAQTLNVPPNRVSQILHGKQAITVDAALRLGNGLGTGPELWLKLQRQYELRLAESDVNGEIKRQVVPLDRSSKYVDEQGMAERSA
jgi:antitoxin HigA-1